jgi:chromosome segregation ATPase
MPRKWCLAFLLAGVLAVLAGPAAPLARAQRQDYLTQTERNKIRNAFSASAKIKLFLDFAADRLARFNRELVRKDTGPRRNEFLNSLLNSFTHCVNSASYRIDSGVNNGQKVKKAIEDFQKRVPKFLAELEKLKTNGTDIRPFRFSLSDSISDLKGDIRDAEKQLKKLEFNPPVKLPHRERH